MLEIQVAKSIVLLLKTPSLKNVTSFANEEEK
jgi:hypothetical protein